MIKNPDGSRPLSLGLEVQRKLELLPLPQYFLALQRILEELRRVDRTFLGRVYRELELSTLRALDAAVAGEENYEEADAFRQQWEARAVADGESMDGTDWICYSLAIELSESGAPARRAASDVMTAVVNFDRSRANVAGLSIANYAHDVVEQLEREIYGVDDWKP